jgi:hypothetical protein
VRSPPSSSVDHGPVDHVRRHPHAASSPGANGIMAQVRGVDPGPVRRMTSVPCGRHCPRTNGVYADRTTARSSARSARRKARRRAWRCPAPPPRRCRSLPKKSASPSIRARTQCSCSIKPAGAYQAPSSSRRTSHCRHCRLAHPGRTRSRIAGSPGARTGSPTASSRPATASPTAAAMPGTTFKPPRRQSPPSVAAQGPMGPHQ